jgi:hypothetical protein
MAFPLTAVLSATPGIISAAADILRFIRKNKDVGKEADSEKLTELAKLAEKQAILIEEMAVNNRNLALAVRNNRIIAVIAMLIACVASILAISF